MRLTPGAGQDGRSDKQKVEWKSMNAGRGALRYTSFFFLSHSRVQSRSIIAPLFGPIKLGPRTDKMMYIAALTHVCSPRHKRQRRSSNDPSYLCKEPCRIFLKRIRPPGNIMALADWTLYPPPAADQSRSDGVQLCRVLRYRLVLECDFSPSPQKKGPSFRLSFLLSF